MKECKFNPENVFLDLKKLSKNPNSSGFISIKEHNSLVRSRTKPLSIKLNNLSPIDNPFRIIGGIITLNFVPSLNSIKYFPNLEVYKYFL